MNSRDNILKAPQIMEKPVIENELSRNLKGGD
jgi:hypothetical protein